MELLILLQTRSDWKNTEYTARSLLTSLVLIYHDSPEALLRAWLDLRMVADDLYRLLYLDEVETLWVTPESAIMWLRYMFVRELTGVVEMNEVRAGGSSN
uniref:RxLR effector candidate protein n=1 Tax=Hyaloperonospora arabidopsidis (strain Emoy2) TaxID=559515 RepID=M4B6A9_HYAAE